MGYEGPREKTPFAGPGSPNRSSCVLTPAPESFRVKSEQTHRQHALSKHGAGWGAVWRLQCEGSACLAPESQGGAEPDPDGHPSTQIRGAWLPLLHRGALGVSTEQGGGWQLQAVTWLTWATGAPRQPQLPIFFSPPSPRARRVGVTYLSGSQERTGSRCCFSPCP